MEKLMTKLAVTVLLLVPIFASASPIQLNKVDIERMLANKTFVFTAETMTPHEGEKETLYTYSDISINGEEALVDLPYFGTFANATPVLDEAAILFTSTDFSYKVEEFIASTEGGKTTWKISIKPYDTGSQLSLNLHVCESGNAMLHVNDNRRSDIRFEGYLQNIANY